MRTIKDIFLDFVDELENSETLLKEQIDDILYKDTKIDINSKELEKINKIRKDIELLNVAMECANKVIEEN